MARIKWATEHKWELCRESKKFENKLIELGYSIAGVRDYVSKTEWLLEKNGNKYECSCPNSNDVQGVNLAIIYDKQFKFEDEYRKLKAEVGGC